MEFWTLILLFTVILTVAVYMLFFSPSFKQQLLSTAAGPFSLKSQRTVIPDSDASPYYTGAEGSFSAYVYLNPMNRTGSYSPCGEPGQASCEDGVYAPCKCDTATGDCSPCAHGGYSTVFSIADIVKLEVLVAPDASRQGKAMTQLVVKTEGPALTSTGSLAATAGSQKWVETFPLQQSIPFQKWVLVTVTREGRRFDVYLNDRIVLSRKAMYMPIRNLSGSNLQGISSGSAGLMGEIGLLKVYNYRLTSAQVATEFNSSADTRGRPYMNRGDVDPLGLSAPSAPGFGISLNDMMTKLNLCPKEGCFQAPVVRPANGLYSWA